MKYVTVQNLFLCFVSMSFVVNNISISAQNITIMRTAPMLMWFILAQDPSSIQIWLKSVHCFFFADNLTNQKTTGQGENFERGRNANHS